MLFDVLYVTMQWSIYALFVKFVFVVTAKLYIYQIEVKHMKSWGSHPEKHQKSSMNVLHTRKANVKYIAGTVAYRFVQNVWSLHIGNITLLEWKIFWMKNKNSIIDEIKETEDKILPQIQRHKFTVDETGYENAIKEICRQEDEICSAVRDFGSKLREKVTQH
jgi:hypothetical protein